MWRQLFKQNLAEQEKIEDELDKVKFRLEVSQRLSQLLDEAAAIEAGEVEDELELFYYLKRRELVKLIDRSKRLKNGFKFWTKKARRTEVEIEALDGLLKHVGLTVFRLNIDKKL